MVLTMARIKIGLSLKSLGVPFRRALMEAQKLGVGGVELDAVGDFAPRHCRRPAGASWAIYCAPTILSWPPWAALSPGTGCGREPTAAHRSYPRGSQPQLRSGAALVVIQAGKVPEKDDDPRAPFMKEGLAALGQHGDRVSAFLPWRRAWKAVRCLNNISTASIVAASAPASIPVTCLSMGTTRWTAPRPGDTPCLRACHRRPPGQRRQEPRASGPRGHRLVGTARHPGRNRLPRPIGDRPRRRTEFVGGSSGGSEISATLDWRIAAHTQEKE